MEKEKIFLVFNTACFGDVLLCNTLCQNIKLNYPNSKIIFICDKPYYEAAKFQKDIDDVIIYDKKGNNKGLLGFFDFIANFPYKNPYCSFITYLNYRNILIAKFLKSKHIISENKKDKYLPVSLQHAKLLEQLTREKVLDLPIKYNIEQTLPSRLASRFTNDKKYIALCTTSKDETKDMPISTALDLINKIHKENYEVVFVGAGNKAKNYSEELKNNNCKFIELINQTSISELGRVSKNCEALISVDTGTMHLGCAVEIPVCAVFYKPKMTNKWAPRKELYNSTIIQENQTAENILKNTKLLMENNNV